MVVCVWVHDVLRWVGGVGGHGVLLKSVCVCVCVRAHVRACVCVFVEGA